ncbi:MAG: conserved membrane protein of unknown function [Promethearchaeota archaeon]|nr:MAG: conserved membrane protein of unknown function [Candidatus Lokiarchaeota archaeon]
MTLAPIELYNGTLFTIFVLISILLGLRIASRYFEKKDRVFLLVGFSWIFIVCPWYPSTIAFFNALITGASPGLSAEIYFILGNIFIPVALFLWLIALTDLLFPKKQILIITLGIIYALAFYILFFYLLSIDPSLIGELRGDIDVSYNLFIAIFLAFTILIVLITGILFARPSLDSEDPKIRLKGKLLIIAFISYTIGTFIDALVTKNFITITIMRVLEISSAIEFYGGFMLPKWMEKLFLK